MTDHSDTKGRSSLSMQPTSFSLTPSTSNPLPRYVDLYLDFEEEKNPDGTLVTPSRARCWFCLKDWRWKDRRRMNSDEDGAGIRTGSACVLDEGNEFVVDRGVLGEGHDGAIKMHSLIHAEGEKYKGELVEWGVI